MRRWQVGPCRPHGADGRHGIVARWSPRARPTPPTPPRRTRTRRWTASRRREPRRGCSSRRSSSASSRGSPRGCSSRPATTASSSCGTRCPRRSTGVPPALVAIGVVAVMTVLATLVVVVSRGRPADMGRAEAEYDREGRIHYRHLPAGVAYSLTSLWSGAVIGPEAALIDLNGAIGTWVADRLSMTREQVRTLTYAGVGGRVRGVLRRGTGRRAARRRAHQPQVGEHQPDADRRGARGGCLGLGRLCAARRRGDLPDPALRADDGRHAARPRDRGPARDPRLPHRARLRRHHAPGACPAAAGTDPAVARRARGRRGHRRDRGPVAGAPVLGPGRHAAADVERRRSTACWA